MKLETTACSAIHGLRELVARFLERHGLGAFTSVALYVGAVFITFVPLCIVASFDPLSMTSNSYYTHNALRLPLVYDVCTIFMYLVLFPSVLVLATTDQDVVNSSLERTQTDGVVKFSEEDAKNITTRWQRCFRTTNFLALAIGIIAGLVVVVNDYQLDIREQSWAAYGGRMTPAGYIRLYCDFLLSVLSAVYIIRAAAIIVLLGDIVSHAQIITLPLHPDNAGGLEPFGHIGLRNQYAVALYGLTLLFGCFVSNYYTLDNEWIGLLIAGSSAYFIIAPLSFFGPLLPFHEVMLKNKSKLMNEVVILMHSHFDELHSRLQTGDITEYDERLTERLQSIGALIQKMPAWPIDSLTQGKFFATYIAPLLTSIVSLAASKAFQLLFP